MGSRFPKSLIRRLREQAGIDHYDAARAYGVAPSTYLALERHHMFKNSEGIKRVDLLLQKHGAPSRQTFFLRAYRDADPVRQGQAEPGTGHSRLRPVESSTEKVDE